MWLKVLLTVSCFAATAPAFAQKGACRDDAQKFCAGVEKGGGRLLKCLKEHEAELSGECKARGDEVRAKVKANREACAADVGKLCSGVKAGGGRIMKCLKEHRSELSPGCAGQVK